MTNTAIKNSTFYHVTYILAVSVYILCTAGGQQRHLKIVSDLRHLDRITRVRHLDTRFYSELTLLV